MATVPVLQDRPATRPVDPGYQREQSSAADFGALQAQSLERSAGAIDQASNQLAQAAVQQQAKIDAVSRARDLSAFSLNGQTNLDNLATTQDITNPAVVKNYGDQLQAQADAAVAAHTGSPDSKAALAQRLTLARTQLLSRAQAMSTDAQDKMVQNTIGAQLQPITAAAYNDPSKLALYFSSSDGVVHDMLPALGTVPATVYTNRARQQILQSAVQGLIDRNQLDEASKIMSENASILTPETQRALQSHITVAQVEQDKLKNAGNNALLKAEQILGRPLTDAEKMALAGVERTPHVTPADLINQYEAIVHRPATQEEVAAFFHVGTAINPYGNSLTGRAMQFVTENSTLFAQNMLSPDQDRQYQASVALLSKPTTYTDPVTNTVVQRTQPLPPFVEEAYKSRGLAMPAATGTPLPEPAAAPAPAAGPPAPNAASILANEPTVPPAAAAGGASSGGNGSLPPGAHTIWDLNAHGLVTGPMAEAGRIVQRAPGIGNFAGHEMTQAKQSVELAGNQLITALQNNPRYAQGERNAIQKEIGDLQGTSFDNSDAYAARLIAVDDFLAERENAALKDGQNRTLPVETQRAARQAVAAIQHFRDILGVPPVLTPEEAKSLQPGQPFRTQDGRLMYRSGPKAGTNG